MRGAAEFSGSNKLCLLALVDIVYDFVLNLVNEQIGGNVKQVFFLSSLGIRCSYITSSCFTDIDFDLSSMANVRK
jgi:hypothetical protein